MKTSSKMSIQKHHVNDLKNQLLMASDLRYCTSVELNIVDVFRMARPDVRMVWLASNQNTIVQLLASIEED